MIISVVICTWNRSALLDQTLANLATSVTVPEALDWELLVVDNGSTDATAQIADAYRDRLPLRYVLESTPGLSHARNRAVAEVRGDYVIWTDDDVLHSADWLESYLHAFEARPEAAVFGGPIEPWFPGAKPAWLDRGWEAVRGAYALRDLGPDMIPLRPDAVPSGANMVIRSSVQKRFPYDTMLGHKGEDRTGGEETQVLKAILMSGETGWWVPDARLWHYIPPERQTISYVRSYYLGRGRRLRYEAQTGRGRKWSRRRWLAEAYVAHAAYFAGRLLRRPEFWVEALRRASIARGYLSASTLERAQGLPGRPPSSPPERAISTGRGDGI